MAAPIGGSRARGLIAACCPARIDPERADRQDRRKGIAVEVPSHAQHSQHDADPGFQEFNRLADAFQPEAPLVYGGQVLHAV